MLWYYNNANDNYYQKGKVSKMIHKRSKKRDAILKCVRSTDAHPSAEWVYEKLKGQIPDLSLATVYRNLATFKKEGIITSLGTVNGTERFERNVVPHTHFVCNECFAVIDVDVEIPSGLSEGVDCGEVTSCTLCFNGVCNSCAEKAAVNNKK